jgi:hypothetical protein
VFLHESVSNTSIISHLGLSAPVLGAISFHRQLFAGCLIAYVGSLIIAWGQDTNKPVFLSACYLLLLEM